MPARYNVRCRRRCERLCVRVFRHGPVDGRLHFDFEPVEWATKVASDSQYHGIPSQNFITR